MERAFRARIAKGKFRSGTRANRGPKPNFFSIVWKNREKIFHTVENFPQRRLSQLINCDSRPGLAAKLIQKGFEFRIAGAAGIQP